jgi:hypothetical protein
LITLHSVIQICILHALPPNQRIRALLNGRQVDVLRVGLMLGILSSTNMPQPQLAAVVSGVVNKLMHYNTRRSLKIHSSAPAFLVFDNSSISFSCLRKVAAMVTKYRTHNLVLIVPFFPRFAQLPLISVVSVVWIGGSYPQRTIKKQYMNHVGLRNIHSLPGVEI